MEIDILAVDEVECESRPSQDDVDDFWVKLGRFKRSFPQYANYIHRGALDRDVLKIMLLPRVITKCSAIVKSTIVFQGHVLLRF
jgi:hypothetical protein